MNLNLYDQEKFVKEGGRTQEVIWIEELGELQHELTKSLRGMLSKTQLVEEFADVLICLEQLKIKYNISDEQLQEWIDYKYKRNCKRLEQEKMWDDFIDKWGKVKKENKGAKRQLAKLMLNSLYGKFGTNPDVTGKIPYLDDENVVKWKLGEKELRNPIYIPMGVFIYADTDSLHLVATDIPKAIEHIIDDKEQWIDYKYNRNCNRLEQKETIKNPKYDDLKDLFK